MNYLLMITCIALSITEIATNNVIRKINAYFGSEAVKSFETQWRKHQISFEHTMKLALQQGYGHKSMNVYINRFQNPLAVSVGYYHTDNQVHMVIANMALEELPHIIDSDVDFSLSSNVLSFDASVSKIIVHGGYVLFRNKSDIIFSLADQNPYKSSPFRFQQVRNVGEVAITIEGCILSGIVIATLSGNSVHLGHDQLKLTECQYNLEIHSPGTGAPPVMAPYLPKGDKRLNIEHLLMRPITEELLPKLQASMFSYINTSAIFTDKLLEIHDKQKKIFEETQNFMDQVVNKMNVKSIKSKMGTIKMGDFSIVWDDAFEVIPEASTVKLSNMLLMGLDTLYSSHTGGPYRLTDTEITEQLRFGALQVVGNISVKGLQDDNEFAVEIFDFAVDVTLDSNLKPKFDPVGWRFLEFSCPKMEFAPVESLVVGYLLNELPKRVTSHLKSVFDCGSQKLNQPTNYEEYNHEQAADGTHSENIEETDNNNQDIIIDIEVTDEGNGDLHQTLSNKGIQKLNDDGSEVKLHHIDVEPEFVEKGPIKLHHVDVEPYQSNEVPVKLRHVAPKTHVVRNAQSPHEVSKKHARNKLLKVGKKLHRAVSRKLDNKVNRNIKPIKRVITRLNQTAKTTRLPKSIHTSDNEVR